jgi:phytoene/squalene synthetase
MLLDRRDERLRRVFSMRDASAALARSITANGSKQTYYTARLVVDRGLVDDFCRAYAYFRWLDDVVDSSAQAKEETISFVTGQRELIECLYNGERRNALSAEENMAADLVTHDRRKDSGLRSFITNMMAIIEFDARRRGCLISEEELSWYSDCVAKSVTDGIQYFVGNGHDYPAAENRYLAANAAHIAHLLRDTIPDSADGFFNIPREYLEANGIGSGDVTSVAFKDWVKKRVEKARQYFREGKRYLDGLDVLRCRVAGHWYCARFETVLDAIERDDYLLRATYNERRKTSTWLRIAWLGAYIAVRHTIGERKR